MYAPAPPPPNSFTPSLSPPPIPFCAPPPFPSPSFTNLATSWGIQQAARQAAIKQQRHNIHKKRQVPACLLLYAVRECLPACCSAVVLGGEGDCPPCAHRPLSAVHQWGIHHLVLPAVLETPPGRDAYGVMEVWEDRIVLRGVDTMMSLVMADNRTLQPRPAPSPTLTP